MNSVVLCYILEGPLFIFAKHVPKYNSRNKQIIIANLPTNKLITEVPVDLN